MAITPVGWTGTPYSSSGATTRNITLPTGIQAGDFIVIWSSTQDSSSPGAPTAPGFTQRWSLGHASAFRPLITCLYKVAAGTESGTTVTLTWGTSLDNSLVCGVFRGVDVASPFNATQTGPTNGTNNPDPAAITTVTDGAWVLVVAAANRPGGTSTPTISDFYSVGVTQVPDERVLVVTYRERAVAAAGDPTAWAWSPIDHHTTVTDALSPASVTVATAGAATGDASAGEASVAVTVPPIEVGPAGLHFADGGRTNPRVEVALNHASVSSPTGWQWTDVSDRLVSRLGDLQIDTKRGRADEAADTEPSEATLILDNTDGYLTPGFAMSPWWPNVDVGLPLRIWEDGTEPALVLPGQAGAYAYTPDHASLDITGDLDVRIRLEPNAWSVGATFIDEQVLLDRSQRLASKWGGAGNRSWWFALYNAGWLQSGWSADGTATTNEGQAFPTLIAALRPIWVGWTLDVDDGDGGHQHVWYRWDGDDPPDDITEWTVVAIDNDTGTASLHSGSGQLELGSRSLGSDATYAGRILAFQVRDGINGTVVANPDFTVQVPGTTSFVDEAGRTWQLSGAAEISRRRVRFCGEITGIEPVWPYGDHQPLAALGDDRATEARVAVTAHGVLRRLTARQDPLRSTLARKIVTLPNVVGYWPCEEGRSAVQLSPGTPGAYGPLNAFGLDMAATDTLPASAPLPKIPGGGLAIWQGAVPLGPSVAWAVEMVLFIETPETSPTFTQILGITTAGSVARWAVAVNDTNIRIVAYDASNAELHSYEGGLFDISNEWFLFRLDASQGDTGIDFAWSMVGLDTGGGGGDDDTATGETLGRVTGIDTHVTGPPDGMSFGHIIVHDGALGVGWLAGADTAWVGESAAHRFWRLCREEGIPASVIGDPGAAASLRGDLTYSQAMGPQGRKRLGELLSECVAIDLGLLIEAPGVPGLIFRCRHTLEDQAAQLTLDAAGNDVADLAPTRDNQTLVNDLTVTSAGGGSAVVENFVSRVRQGRYANSVEIAGVGGLDIQDAIIATQDGLAAAVDTQNVQQAGWRLALGTADGMRYPVIVIDLGTAPHLIDTWLATALGDRVTLTGLPVQHPTDVVELLIQHAAEKVTPTAWVVELVVTPGEPWMTGELVE